MARALISLLLLSVIKATIFSNSENQSLKVNVIGATDTYSCFLDKCFNISSYSLYQKKTEIGCRGEGLNIEYRFKVNSADASPTITTGYLANKGAENNIYEKQVFSKNCKVIRRYYVNKDSSLVTVGYFTEFLENSDICNFILTQLRQQGFYWQYIIHKLGLYNEDEDNIEYLLLFSWSFIIFCITYTAMGNTKYVLRHLREMKNMYSIHKSTSQKIVLPNNEPVCYPSTNKASDPSETPIICYPGANNALTANNLFSLNSNIGYRAVKNTDKDALLEAFKQKIGYYTDQETLMDAFKQNSATRVKNQKQIKSN